MSFHYLAAINNLVDTIQWKPTTGTLSDELQVRRCWCGLTSNQSIANAFCYFTLNQWIFDNKFSQQLIAKKFPDQANFKIDIQNVNWDLYFQNFAYGIKRFVLKEVAEMPAAG